MTSDLVEAEVDHDDLHDLLCTAIDDSMDMDWQSGWAADSIISAMEREGLTVVKQPARDSDGPSERDRVLEEREACARVAENYRSPTFPGRPSPIDIAQAIRARSQEASNG